MFPEQLAPYHITVFLFFVSSNYSVWSMLKVYASAVLFLFCQSDFGTLAQIVKNIIYRLRQFVRGENSLGSCSWVTKMQFSQ